MLVATLLQAACSTLTPDSHTEVSASLPQSQPQSQPQAQPQAPAPAPRETTLHIAAVGDIMLGSDYPNNRLSDDPSVLLAPVSATLQQADIAFGNLEGVLLDGGEARKRCQGSGGCYVFRTPASYAQYLVNAGFDVVSLANNHTRDFGEEGRRSTMATLDAAGIRHSGPVGDVASWEVSGLQVAMIAFAPYAGSHDLLDLEQGRDVIAALAATHDVVMVSFHGGAEGADKVHVPFAPEIFHGEARGDVVSFAHMAVEAGADIVIGHGPHVPRAVELYQGRLIAYSLGNFATYWGVNVQGNNGLAPILLADLDGEGRFLTGRIVSTRQQRPYGPLPDPHNEAAKLVRSLTLSDFPSSPLIIDNDGTLRVNFPVAADASLGRSP